MYHHYPSESSSPRMDRNHADLERKHGTKVAAVPRKSNRTVALSKSHPLLINRPFEVSQTDVSSSLSHIHHEEQQDNILQQQRQVLWDDVLPVKPHWTRSFTSLNFSLTRLFCPPVVHDYDISIMGPPGACSLTSSSSSSHESLMEADPTMLLNNTNIKSVSPFPTTRPLPRPSVMVAAQRNQSAPVVTSRDSFSSESSVSTSRRRRHGRNSTTILSGASFLEEGVAAFSKTESAQHDSSLSSTWMIGGSFITPTHDDHNNHHLHNMSPLTVMGDSPPTVPKDEADETLSGKESSDDDSLLLELIAPSSAILTTTPPTILEECPMTPNNKEATADASDDDDDESLDDSSWTTMTLQDDDGDLLLDDELQLVNETSGLSLKENPPVEKPVYLAKCQLFENYLLQQHPQATVCVSGWVAFSTHDNHNKDDFVNKVRNGSLRKNNNNKHLAYMVLLSHQATLYLFQSRQNKDHNNKRRFVIKAVELPRQATVETQLVNSQLGHAIVVKSSSSWADCTLLPVDLGSSCFERNSQQSVLTRRAGLTTILSGSHHKHRHQPHWDNYYAPIEQHEAVMHVRFALDSLIRMPRATSSSSL